MDGGRFPLQASSITGEKVVWREREREEYTCVHLLPILVAMVTFMFLLPHDKCIESEIALIYFVSGLVSTPELAMSAKKKKVNIT